MRTDNPTVLINPNAQLGTKLYERFHKALRRAKDKTVKVMFHGTSVISAASILKKGMDPAKRVSGGDWFTTDPNYALQRAISREEALERCYVGFCLGSHGCVCGGALRGDDGLSSATVGAATWRGTPPLQRTVKMLGMAVIMDNVTHVGCDHIMITNHLNSIPIFVMEFHRVPNAPPPQLLRGLKKLKGT